MKSYVTILLTSFVVFTSSLQASSSVTYLQNQDPGQLNCALPVGMYFLCCQNGDLILYNIVGQMVGWGDDCGGLHEGDCFRVWVCSTPICQDNLDDEEADQVLKTLNSLTPATGEDHEGDFCDDCKTFYFSEEDVDW